VYVYTSYSSIHMVNHICLYKVFQYTCGQPHVYTRYSSIHMINCICLYKVFQYTCGQPYVYTRYSSVHMINCIYLYKVFQYTCGQPCMFMQGIPVEIQTATYWGLISRSIMALSPLLLPSSILPLPSSHSVLIPTRKNVACIMKVLFLFHFFKNHVI